MNTQVQFTSTINATETSEASAAASKLSYHAPMLTVHGKLERVTQQSTSSPTGGGGGGVFDGDA